MGVCRFEKDIEDTEITSMYGVMGALFHQNFPQVYVNFTLCLVYAHRHIVAPGIQQAGTLHNQSKHGDEGNTHSPCWEFHPSIHPVAITLLTEVFKPELWRENNYYEQRSFI